MIAVCLIPLLPSLDLLPRYQQDLPLNEVDSNPFYGGGVKGYMIGPPSGWKHCAYGKG